MTRRSAHRSEGGFTLVELLIVVLILGALGSTVVVASGGFKDKGVVQACQAARDAYVTGFEAYRADNVDGLYPANDAQVVPAYVTRSGGSTATVSGTPEVAVVSGKGWTFTITYGSLAAGASAGSSAEPQFSAVSPSGCDDPADSGAAATSGGVGSTTVAPSSTAALPTTSAAPASTVPSTTTVPPTTTATVPPTTTTVPPTTTTVPPTTTTVPPTTTTVPPTTTTTRPPTTTTTRPPTTTTTTTTLPSGLVLQPAKATYKSSERPTLVWSGFPAVSPYDWISIAPVGTPDDQYPQWSYLNGQKSGSQLFNALTPGTYEARGYYDWPNGWFTVKVRTTFTVTAG